MGSDSSEDVSSASSEQGGGSPKRRRRRRGGRRRGGGPDSTPSEGADRPKSDRSEASEGSSRHGGRGRRRRGGRPDRDEDRGERQGRDSGGAPGDSGPRKRSLPSKTWEEIFGDQTFADLGLRSSVIKGCEAAGFTNPTKIQADLIPLFLQGKDVLGQSRTGSGKTAAFGLPLLHMVEQGTPFQAIVLGPTRELAIQSAEEIADIGRFTPLKVSAVYGGQRIRTQAEQLELGPEIIVATPGRLIDMVERGHLSLRNVRHVVLDEVDRMLDIGFRDDIRQILKSIKTKHQTVFVSATISPEIEKLARSFMTDPEKIIAAGGSLTVSLVEQYYISVERWDKKRLMLHLLTHEEPELTLVFCRMKRTVDELTKYLKDHDIDAHAIHGDMYQGKRDSVMKRLRSGRLGVLVASDLAARGLDVEGITHVVNYDLPEDPEIYVHRIGRTARAGRGGVAWSFVTPEQGGLLTEIEKLANTHVPEKAYDDFQPGDVPRHVRAERADEAQRIEVKRAQTRYAPRAPENLSNASRPDDPRFPGGVVPSKLPPKRMQGKVRTTRSMRGAPDPNAVPPPPKEPE